MNTKYNYKEFSSSKEAEQFVIFFQKDEEWKSVISSIGNDGKTVVIVAKDGMEDDAMMSSWAAKAQWEMRKCE